MLTGHASHQIGLDADIWLTPMPDRTLSGQERENMSAVSMIRKGGLTVDDRLWTPAHMKLLKRAASYGQVERILVHPGIKKKLCDTVTGDRSWLKKIRPFWGHDYHFHIRIGCQAGFVRLQGAGSAAGRRGLRQVAGLVVHRRAVAPQPESRRAKGARRHDHGEPAEAMPRRARGAGSGLRSGRDDRRQRYGDGDGARPDPRRPIADLATSAHRNRVPLPKVPLPQCEAGASKFQPNLGRSAVPPLPGRPRLFLLAQTTLGRRQSRPR